MMVVAKSLLPVARRWFIHMDDGDGKTSRIDKAKAAGFDMFSFAYLFIVTAWIYGYYRGSVPGKGGGELLASGIAGVVVGFACFLSGRSPGAEIFGFLQQTDSDRWKNWRRSFCFVLMTLTFITGIVVTKFSLQALFDADGLHGVSRILSALVHPEMSILSRALKAVIETIYIAFISTMLAIPPAFLLSFLGAKNFLGKSNSGRLLYMGVRGTINLLRSIEPLIWAIIFSIWVGIGPFAGMMALMVNSIAGLTKLYSEQIESIDEELVVALQSTGASRWHVLWFAVVPQITLPFLAFSIYRWDVNVRMATVIGLVGGGGIGTLLMQYQGLAKWNEVGLIIILISLVVWGMDFLSATIRERVV